jgi:DNA-binding response OmpR family regulator
VKVLVVEDDPILGEALRAQLERVGAGATLVADGAEADHWLATQSCELVILDLGLPGLGGLEVLQRMRRRGDRKPVLVLTARDELADRMKGFAFGADDYLAKPFEMAELVARAKALYRRAYGAGQDDLAIGRLRFDPFGRRATIDGFPIDLSAREAEVLEILMMRAGRVVSKQTLLLRLYEDDTGANVNAVEVFLHRLRRKITGSGATIRTIRGLGYLLEKDGDGKPA